MKYYINIVVFKSSKERPYRRHHIKIESTERLTFGEIKPLIREKLEISDFIEDKIIFDENQTDVTDSDTARCSIDYEIVIN